MARLILGSKTFDREETSRPYKQQFDSAERSTGTGYKTAREYLCITLGFYGLSPKFVTIFHHILFWLSVYIV